MSKYTNDLLSSVVVFLVALPLCMGISIASGVPPAAGIITGIIGGIVAGSLAGAPLQVSGPAAGLTVLVADMIRDHGIGALGPIVLIAGLFQILAGKLRIGVWFRAMSPAVVFGMLAGIGVLILASQTHVMLDDKPASSGLQNLIAIPNAIFNGIFPIDGSPHEMAAVLGILTITVLVGWEKLRPAKLKMIPGALLGVVAATCVANFLGLRVKYVDIPSNLLDAVQLPGSNLAEVIASPAIWFSALAMAFIASAETLLSANAVDRMQSYFRTDYDKELLAQGVGNSLCGLLGALPMTGVIVRSSANVNAGARTRMSTILHGTWLLAFVVLLPHGLRLIPTSSLGAILVFTGWKLLDIKNIRMLSAYGRIPLFIYAATLITIVATDLLTGVITGVVLSLLKLVYMMSRLETIQRIENGIIHVELVGAATFVRMPQLAAVLESIEPRAHVHLEIRRLVFLDHAGMDFIQNWVSRHQDAGGTVHLEWSALEGRQAPLEQSPALTL